MEINQIASKQDLLKLEENLKSFIHAIIVATNQKSNSNKLSYLRTKQVKALLKISDNKLKDMREKGEIPWSFIGRTYYYPEDDILKILKENTISKKIN